MHENAPTRYINVGGLQIAYRHCGPPKGIPLLTINYFAAHMDNWDPAITNGFTSRGEVVLFDYPAVGGSTGDTPRTVNVLTTQCFAIGQALNLKTFDVVGFSLGGMITQQLAVDQICFAESFFSARAHVAEKA